MSAAAASLILLDSAWALQQKPERKLPDPTISVHKQGLRINSRLAKIMGLKEGDLVMLAQDPKFPKDFYLMVHPRGFNLVFSKHGEGRISCSAYFRLICQVLELSETQHKFLRFKVAEKPDTIGNFRCYAVNTVHPLYPAADAAPDQGEERSPAEGA
jgi:hypothetical protein